MKKSFLLLSIISASLFTFGATYTWTGAGDGLNWTDAANWTSADEGATYPNKGVDIAIIPEGETTIAVTNRIDIQTLDLERKNSKITFIGGEQGTNVTLTAGTRIGLPKMGSTLILSKCSLKCTNNAMTLTKNVLFRLEDGARFMCQNITHNYGGRLEITEGSTFDCNQLQFDDPNSVIIISDSTLSCRNQIVMVQYFSNPKIRFEGKNPKLIFTAANGNPFFNGNNHNVSFEFSIPKGGYAETPIQSHASSSASFMFRNNRTGSMGYLSVDENSPCFSEACTFEQPLVQWTSSHATPIDLSVIQFTDSIFPEDNYFLLSADATEPTYTKASDFTGTAKSIGYKVKSTAHDDTIFVRSEPAGIVDVASPTGGHETGDVLTLSAPDSVVVDNIDYRLSGYSLVEYTAGSFRGEATTNFVAGVSSFNYTFQGKETEVIWHYISFPVITTAVVNDTAATITKSGDGLNDPTKAITFTAATTDETFEFQYWYGEIPYEKRYSNPLTFVPSNSGEVNAFFGKKEGEKRVANLGLDKKQFFSTAAWAGGVIPGTNDTAVLVSARSDSSNGSNKGRLTTSSFFAVKDLVISNAMIGVNVPEANFNMGAKNSDYYGSTYYRPLSAVNKTRTETIGCDIFGDITLDAYSTTAENNGGMIYVGGLEQEANTRIHVMGNVNINNGAIVLGAGTVLNKDLFDPLMSNNGPQYHVDYPDIVELFRGKNYFRVDGDTILAKPTAKNYINEIHISNDPRTGTAMWLDMKDVYIGEGAKFSATLGGYNRVTVDGRQYSMCPGGTCNQDNTSGGSYGGLGGHQSTLGEYTTFITTYGYENAPIHPGSPRGGSNYAGGGTIRLDCETLVLDGTLCSHGTEGSGNKGSGAGGGIFVLCDTFTPGANSLISVCGGGWSNGTNAGGGGGRASICVGLSPEQEEALVFSENHTASDIAISPLGDVLGERFTARGGPGSANRSEGQAGTGVYIVNTKGKKTLTVAGDPENIGSPIPAYGPGVYDDGATISLTGPAGTFVRDDNRSRRTVSGYTITDENGNVLTTSEAASGSWTLSENATLTWDLTRLEHEIAIGATKGGTIVTNQIDNSDSKWQADGSAVSITAIPNAGYVFKGWYGEVEEDWVTSTDLSFEADTPRTIGALFEATEEAENTWTGNGDGANYLDHDNWSLGRIPGTADNVTIPAGANVTASLCAPVEIGSLTIESGASLTFIRNLTTFSTFTQLADEIVPFDTIPILVKINGNINVGGTFTLGRPYSAHEIELDVSGNFSVSGTANFFAGFKQLVWNDPALWQQGGGRVRVGGTLTISEGGTLFSSCENLCGATVVFDVGNLTVENGGTFSANGGGYQYSSIGGSNVSYVPLLGNTGGYAGGTHAGAGGQAVYHNPSYFTYGYPYAPYLPGSPGFNTSLNAGGGVIRVNVRNQTFVKGTITARGVNSAGLNGGGAGGSIWITTKRFRTAPTALFTAQGGNGTTTINGNCGSGGGGRIAISVGLTQTQIDSLYEDGEISSFSNFNVIDLTTAPAGSKITPQQINVDGGESVRPDSDGREYKGKPGTAYYVRGPKTVTLFLVR